jgi:hypothetical protein
MANQGHGPTAIAGPGKGLTSMLSIKLSGKLAALALMLFFVAGGARAQAQDSPAPGQQAPGIRGEGRGRGDGPPPLVGKIASIKDGTLELSTPDGSSVVVKLSDKTEFRKDRQPAKIGDFKVGDMIFVRGEQNADHSVTAAMVAARSGGGPGEQGGQGAGRGFGGGAGFGEMGKDYVAGEIKSVDAPKITVLRSDNVTQTIELNEETSLRKGRDSITMADIQPGDHLVVRGSMQNNTFIPKNVMIVSLEQWQRMQEFMSRARGAENANIGAKPNSPAPAPPPQ